MDDGLKKNDPYRGMQSGKDEIKPGFLGGDGGGDKPGGSKKDDKQAAAKEEAAKDLKSAEKSAEDGSLGGVKDKGLSGARKNEEDAKGFYSGSGKDIDDKKKKGKTRFGLKKRGPIIAIFMMIFGIGGAMGAAQLFLPFSLLAQYVETFNSMQTSAHMRSSTFMRLQLGTDVKNPVKGSKIFGTQHFKISESQSTKLASHGIEYDEATDTLKFDAGDGNIKTITADSFRAEYEGNVKFYEAYNAGSMTWRGAIANWFGTTTDKFLATNILTRNMFQDFQQKVNEEGGDSLKVTQDIIARRTSEITDEGLSTKSLDEEEQKTEMVDGKEVTVTTRDEYIKPGDTPSPNQFISDYDEGKIVDGSTVRSSATKMARLKTTAEVSAKLNDISGKVQKGANIACTIVNVIGAISLLVTASEALQIINLTTAYFEAIDKVKAGNGDDSPIHDLTNALTENKTTTNKVLVSTGTWNESDEGSNFVDNGEGGMKTLAVVDAEPSQKSAMEASGVASLYSATAVDASDPSVQSFNFTKSIKRIMGGFGVSMAAFTGCATMKLASNAVSAVTTIAEVAACVAGAAAAIATAGVSTTACGPLLAHLGTKIAFSVAIGVAVAGIIAVITPLVSNMLTRDLVSNLGGEDLGNALTSGANMYLGSNHRANGGSLSSLEKYKEFAVAQQQVIADNAEYERLTKSPFDVTSKYTFMGTLLTKMMSFLSVNSLMSAVSSTNSVLSSSVIAMSPTASAYEIAETIPDMDEYAETCPYLASIGAIGDAYCNPYAITDISTIGETPQDVIDTLDAAGNFSGENEEGNVIIDGSSDLAEYILYCDNRTSAFGIADQNIVNEVSKFLQVDVQAGGDENNPNDVVRSATATFNTAANSAIGAIPVIGDAIDTVTNAKALASIGYISGESCVAGNDVQAAASPDWETAKTYQRFIEDQSLSESMGLINKSAVTAFLEDYYEKNPLDNSYEGILARYSGMDKDTVVALLDIIDYGNYIADYHPEERYVFGAPVVETENELRFDNENELATTYFVLLNQISFADVRNRSFAV